LQPYEYSLKDSVRKRASPQGKHPKMDLMLS
jgi:hypothetical protein